GRVCICTPELWTQKPKRKEYTFSEGGQTVQSFGEHNCVSQRLNKRSPFRGFFARYNMHSFDEFINRMLTEDVSRQGQISQYEKSLTALARVKDRLSRNGMDTD